MGDPRRIRKKYETPTHPWQKYRIEEEKKLMEEYGLKNKKEIWRMETLLKKFKDQVKALASRMDEQSRLEEKQLVNRLVSFGLMNKDDPLDTILGLELKDVFERRLQTLLVRKGLARTMKQARQFITHGHILVDKKKVTFPSYIVTLREESLIEFVPTSPLSKEDHPERMIKEVSKGRVEKKKKEEGEEALPAFAEEEIEEIEEKGVVEKKDVSELTKTEGREDVKEEGGKDNEQKKSKEEEKRGGAEEKRK
ncbi:MAG TPA: 30S ribosomal protein S4 [Candidatus Woesearchaeota archaeon]|nr:30S ribosomal protein S4 [Candidatus Woesearchaeota archaeon]